LIDGSFVMALSKTVHGQPGSMEKAFCSQDGVNLSLHAQPPGYFDDGLSTARDAGSAYPVAGEGLPHTRFSTIPDQTISKASPMEPG
jgi:hypothetical protein